MPTFNRAHFIAESIRSILSQMGDEDELLVVDDGSTDNTADVVREIDSRIRFVRQDNAGKSVALNNGLRLTSGVLIWICDDDDILRPDVVEPLCDELQRSGLDFVFGRYDRFQDNGDTRLSLGTGYWPDLSAGSLQRHILEDAFVMQNAALVRRDAYDAVGPFDETMLRSLDYEMFVRLAVSTSGGYVDRIVFDQRKHEGARGPAQALHAAADSAKVWNDYDRRIFQRLHTRLPISFYEAMFTCADPALVRRAGLLQRGCVNARHDLWENTVADWEAAIARFGAAGDLTAVERAICRRAVAGKHGFGGALVPKVAARLRAMRRAGGIGRDMVDLLLAGMFWRFRQPEAEYRADARRMLVEIAGPVGTAGLVGSHIKQRIAPGRYSTALVECDRFDFATDVDGAPMDA